jgi:hypothetical protein
MNEKEKKELYIATCKCCLLAEAMKTCSTCRFNIGPTEKSERIQPIPVALPVPVTLVAVFEQQQLN